MKKNIHLLLTTLVLSLLLNVANAQTVYVTANGKKYHKKNCKLVNEGKKGITLDEAKKKGLEPCGVCYK